MLKLSKFLFLILCFSSSLTASSQSSNTDSLLHVLEYKKGSERMEPLRQLSKSYMTRSVEEAIKYASELLLIAEEEGDLKYIDLACSFLGEAYFYMDNIEKSIEHFKKFLKTNIQQEDIDGIATAYNNLGIVYRYIEDYETAIQYYLESLAIKEKLNDTARLSTTLNNIGVLYFYMGKYYDALEYYNKSYELEKVNNNKAGIATSLLNIGEVQSKLNNYTRALSCFQQSIELSEQIEDYYTLEINYKCLYEMYKQKVNFQKALYYFELYNETKNARLSQESRKEVAELEIQYETVKKEREIKLLNRQNELSRTIIIILLAGFLLFTILLILLFRQGRAKKRALQLLSVKNKKITEQTEILNKLNSTKDKFFSIISHDLKGTIGGFMAQTEFLADDFENLSMPEMHDLIMRMKHSSQQLYGLLENLLEWSKTQTGSIKLQPEVFDLKKLVDSIVSIFNELMEDKKITALIKINPGIMVFADINMVSTVFRNLIANAIKFSHPASQFKIEAKTKEGFVEIAVADNGIGISEKNQEKLFNIDHSFSSPGTSHEKGSGLGLIISKEFVELNRGKIWFESVPGSGSVFKFTLKLA